ncbi:OB-fold domain-containing protein [Nocardia sp. NPDC047038]|uniref:Zn-ribbon domain-containing OB-fold protein n=1 Tax=Nocardia sp. NPDC047038 TaxID=3154338 RepID=UPI0033E02CAF
MTASARPPRVPGCYEDKLWEFVAEGELRLPEDPVTGELIFPPAAVAPRTLEPPVRWLQLSGAGELVAWTVFRRAYFPMIPIPYTVVVVRSAEGPMFAGHLGGDQSARLRHGMPMRLVFEYADLEAQPTQIFNWVPVSGPLETPHDLGEQ